jgi:zinc/manganese transport system permease protein
MTRPSLTVQVLGLFIVFAALIAPGLWSASGMKQMTCMALALAAAVIGLAASWLWDAPSGPLVALALALCGNASILQAAVIKKTEPPSSSQSVFAMRD